MRPGTESVDVEGVALLVRSPAVSNRMFYVLHSGYEHKEALIAARYITPSDEVLEVGAGIGFIAAYCMKHLQVCRYAAAEANPELIPLIEANLANNGIDPSRFSVHNVLVGTEDGDAEFNVNRNFWSSSVFSRRGTVRTLNVRGMRLRQLVERLDFRPNVLVMDIEGGEVTVPSSDFRLFDKILLELHPKIAGPDRVQALHERIVEMGYHSPESGVYIRGTVD
jgi:FkbM family methyltransferase